MIKNDKRKANGVLYGPQFEKYSLSPWIAEDHSVMIYKFNLFCLDQKINKKMLVEICHAVIKETRKIYSKDYSTMAEIDFYDVLDPSSLVENTELFKGDIIPIFIGDFSNNEFMGMHMIQNKSDLTNNLIDNPTNDDSSMNIKEGLGIDVAETFPAFTPWIAINSGEIMKRLQNGYWKGNPYAYNNVSDFYDLLSFTLCHEVHETLKDDSGHNWIVFNNTAQCFNNWHYLEIDENGNCTNGTLMADGHIYLPLLSDLFPKGCQITVMQETCDPFSRLTFGKLQTHRVKGFAMSNYSTPNFWKPYYSNPDLKYDYKGFSQTPGQPYAGHFEPKSISFLDLKTNETIFAYLVNYGPVTSEQRTIETQREYNNNWKPELNNFPQNYTVVNFIT
jgi:hypothetical protein